ncbi:MAG TPA: alkene reductase [Polyangiaceae bacterium]
MDLFTPFRLGQLELPNRIVMAPMTRSRAIGNVPNGLMGDYYAQRASAGLIVTEGTAPSANALGYARIPGIFSPAQVEGWRAVTSAVHAAGGRIVAQLMHTGRIAHPQNLPAGARILAPSAVRAEGMMYTDGLGPQPMPEPVAMTEDDVREARGEFVDAARNAVHAGFDGVELHAANGYLLEQFLHPHTNRRVDAYGGTVQKRARFVSEVVDAVTRAIGRERVGIRLSPFSTLGDLPPHDETEEQYVTLARALRGLLYVHLVANGHAEFERTHRAIQREYGGPIILNGGFDRARATATLADGRADLVAFGRPFIANPDLVQRMKTGGTLASPEPTTFYTTGPQGYVDYPVAATA